MRSEKEGIIRDTVDACNRCGLRARTRELERAGTVIRLCDDCYWGTEPEIAERVGPATYSGSSNE
jgi:hypothetical protein